MRHVHLAGPSISRSFKTSASGVTGSVIIYRVVTPLSSTSMVSFSARMFGCRTLQSYNETFVHSACPCVLMEAGLLVQWGGGGFLTGSDHVVKEKQDP